MEQSNNQRTNPNLHGGKSPPSTVVASRRTRRLDPRTLAVGSGSVVVILLVLYIHIARPHAPTKTLVFEPIECLSEVTPVPPPPEPVASVVEAKPEPSVVAETQPTVVPVPEVRVTPEPVKPVAEETRLALFKRTPALLRPQASVQANQDLFRDALFLALESGRWDLFQGFLRSGFEGALKKTALRSGADRFQDLLQEPLFVRAMVLREFLEGIDTAFLAGVAENTPNNPFYKWLLQENPEVLSEFLEAVVGQNISPTGVLAQWEKLWIEEPDPKLREKFRALMLACAMVFPAEASQNYSADSPAGKRYRLFRENAKNGRLTGKIHRMKAADLVWVVDVPVSDTEIEWALKNMHLPQRRWGEAYGMIEYLMERAVKGANPYAAYTFEEILKHGGICGDQAYFSANTAKCHGIPAAIVGGTGDRGGHAWMVFMPDTENWEESGNVGYTTGTVRHPATGEVMHESVLRLASDRRNGGERLNTTRMFLRFVALFAAFGQREIAAEALDAALRSTPEHPMPWKAAIAFYAQSEAKTDLKDWEELAATLRRRFRDRPEFLVLAEEVEETHIFPQRDAKENIAHVARTNRRIERAHDGRFDLIAQGVERQANLLRDANDIEGLASLYRKAFLEHGSDLQAFQLLAAQFYALVAQRPEWKDKVCRTIELGYQRHVESTTDDYFRISVELGVLRQVAKYYEMSGNPKRAELLRKRAERREKSSKRAAL